MKYEKQRDCVTRVWIADVDQNRKHFHPKNNINNHRKAKKRDTHRQCVFQCNKADSSHHWYGVQGIEESGCLGSLNLANIRSSIPLSYCLLYSRNSCIVRFMVHFQVKLTMICFIRLCKLVCSQFLSLHIHTHSEWMIMVRVQRTCEMKV